MQINPDSKEEEAA